MLLEIDCGLRVDLQNTDYHSAAVDRKGKQKGSYKFPQYVIFARCPHPNADLINTDLSHVNLQVPKEVDLSGIQSLKKATRLVLLKGTIYPCNRRGTIMCPLTSKKS